VLGYYQRHSTLWILFDIHFLNKNRFFYKVPRHHFRISHFILWFYVFQSKTVSLTDIWSTQLWPSHLNDTYLIMPLTKCLIAHKTFVHKTCHTLTQSIDYVPSITSLFLLYVPKNVSQPIVISTFLSNSW
jgi:hypothetical protein